VLFFLMSSVFAAWALYLSARGPLLSMSCPPAVTCQSDPLLIFLSFPVLAGRGCCLCPKLGGTLKTNVPDPKHFGMDPDPEFEPSV
jgi:hypothetical protein